MTDGSWLNEAASNVNLYASVDDPAESAPNDSDWIQSAASPSADMAELALGPLSPPDQAGDVYLVVRIVQA